MGGADGLPRVADDAALARLVEQVRDSADRKTALEIRGGGTKAFYGARSATVLGASPRGNAIDRLDTRALAGISSYEPTELVVTVRAGTPLAELEADLAEQGQCLPFEPPRFDAGAPSDAGTVGGMVAAGLSGPPRAAVGSVRDYVLGATLLNGRGEVLTFGGQVMKNVAGYDVSRVLAGSLGILGVICEVSLKVLPLPAAVATLQFECDQADALRRLNEWGGQPLPINASAWHQGRLLLRLAGAHAAVRSACARLGGEALAADEAAQWWRAVRDHRHALFAMNAAQLADGERLWRLSVPSTAAPIRVDGAGDEDWFIDWGGAQRWLRTRSDGEKDTTAGGTLPQTQTQGSTIRAVAAQTGGHATLFRAADPSDGVFAALAEPLARIHRGLKHAFDPNGVFNPGRLYPDL